MTMTGDRQRMLDEQLRDRGIRDRKVLDAMESIPRERFVPAELLEEAYADRALPLGGGQTISQPFIVGLIAQSLRLTAHETVLEVGSGSGYMAAVLARLANWVIGIEMEAHLVVEAARRMEELSIDHVEFHAGDGTLGWPAEAPFDAIVVSAASPSIPPALIEQLADGGRLVVPLGDPGGTQQLTLITRSGSELGEHVLCPCRFVPLIFNRN